MWTDTGRHGDKASCSRGTGEIIVVSVRFFSAALALRSEMFNRRTAYEQSGNFRYQGVSTTAAVTEAPQGSVPVLSGANMTLSGSAAGVQGTVTPPSVKTGRARLQIFIAASWMLTASFSTCRAQPSPSQPVDQETWRKSMSRTPLPKHGCFHAKYPDTEWREVQCVTAPLTPHGLTRGARPDNAGNGNDFFAQVSSGPIAQATGGFLFAYNAYQDPGESDTKYGPNAFSLQLNANRFTSSLCPGCVGWEQFIFDNFPGSQDFSGVYIQYWLFNAESCPPSWTFYGGGSGGEPGCYFNSPGTPVTPLTITDLDNLYLQGTVDSSQDLASLINYGTNEFSAIGQDSLLNLSQNWNAAEFNIFGYGDSSEAVFNFGTVIGVQTEVIAPTSPTCGDGGTTGESNNLNLEYPCFAYTYGPVLGGTLGFIEFWEDYTGATTPPLLITGSASEVTTTYAVLNGTVNPYLAGPLVWFQYSTSSGDLNCTSPALTEPQNTSNLSINLPAAFNSGATGLSSGTTYYFVTCALYSGGLVEGGVASFTTQSPPQYQLTVSEVGQGTVTSTDGEINCTNGSGMCSASYPSGSTVTLNATGATNWTFTGWSGSCSGDNSCVVTINGNVSSTATFTSPGLMLVSVPPCRVADTRQGFGFSGAFGPPSLAAGATRSFPIPQSSCDVPGTAEAYSLNITVVPPGPFGYLTAWPTGWTIPNVSTLNAPDGIVTANAALLTTGTDGAVNLFASDQTDVIIDINGYFAPPPTPLGLAFYPMSPCRVADTRENFGFTGAFGPPSLVGGATRNFPMQQSSCAIPSAAVAYSVRMTAVADDGPLGYLTTWPMGETLPNVSTLNAPLGGVVGNQTIVPAGSDSAGSLSVFVSNTADLLIDINGYFGPPGLAGALYFYPTTPCRIADTRAGFGFSGAFGPPSLIEGATRNFPVSSSSCGIPSSAQAYSLNLTAVVPSGGQLGYLTAFPAGAALPNASTLNAPDGGVVASAAIVPAGTSGAINVFSSNATDLIIDINGYFAP
jgi:hypothetical protein